MTITHAEYARHILSLLRIPPKNSVFAFTPDKSKSKNAAKAMTEILCNRLSLSTISRPVLIKNTTFEWDGGIFNCRNIADRDFFWSNLGCSVAEALHDHALKKPVAYILSSVNPHDATVNVWAIPEPNIYAILPELPKNKKDTSHILQININGQRFNHVSSRHDLGPFFLTLRLEEQEKILLNESREADVSIRKNRRSQSTSRRSRDAETPSRSDHSNEINAHPSPGGPDDVTLLTSLIRITTQTIVNEWKKEILSPKEMADAFLNHPIVRKFMRFLKDKAGQSSPSTAAASTQKPQALLPKPLIQRIISIEALQDLDDEIANRGGDMNHPAIRAKFVTPAQGSKYSNYVVEIGKDLQTDQQFFDDPLTLDAILSRAQKTINKKLGIAEIQHASGSSPPVIKDLTVSRNVDWYKLMRVEQTPQNLFDIVFDPEFNGENVFEPHINAVEKRIDRIKSLFTQSDYDKMKERLKQVRKEMDEYDA